MSNEGQVVGNRVSLYVRSLVPDGYNQRQAAVIKRLGRLVDQGVLTERQVQPCGQQLPATPAEATTETGEWLLERFFTFREWAAINGLDLTPAFEVREVNDSLTDTRYRALRPPAILLAEYRESDVVCVTPHCDGETDRTVLDRIAELEAGSPTAFEPVASATTEAELAPLLQR